MLIRSGVAKQSPSEAIGRRQDAIRDASAASHELPPSRSIARLFSDHGLFAEFTLFIARALRGGGVAHHTLDLNPSCESCGVFLAGGCREALKFADGNKLDPEIGHLAKYGPALMQRCCCSDEAPVYFRTP